MLHSSSIFTTAALPPGVQRREEDAFLRYATLGDYDYAEHLDYLQMYYPLFSEGYALAFAEYTQKFVLQYYGQFHGGSGTTNATATTCNIVTGSAQDVEKTECQLTFEQTLSSVFPLMDAAQPPGPSSTTRTSNLDTGAARATLSGAVPPCQALCNRCARAHSRAGTASKIRASLFHPTRTGGTSTTGQGTAQAETLTFRHIFGRTSMLAAPDTLESGQVTYADMTPVSNAGTVINTAAVVANASYTNGKYTITDPNNLKQKSRKQTVSPGPGGQTSQYVTCPSLNENL